MEFANIVPSPISGHDVKIAREQLGAGNAGFATPWELPGSWEPGSLLRKTASWEAILGIKTAACMP